MDAFIHLNVTQDIGHGVTVIFVCCVIVIVAVLLDLNTGINAARKNKEKIQSRILRRTVAKILDYLRVLVFGVMVDVLGLSFPWYSVPYCTILVTLGVLAIEGKSMLENYKKAKSSAKGIAEEIKNIIECLTADEAEKIIKRLKDKGK